MLGLNRREILERIKTIYYFMKGDCVFCKIIEEGKEEKILYENEDAVVFAPLESGILSKGHLLVVPKEHHENIFDIPQSCLDSVMETVKTISQRLEKDGFEGVNLLNASGKAAQQSVDHFHIHLVPRKESDERDMWPESDYEENSYRERYRKIKEIINQDSL